jgi:hypothetical protein
VKGMGNFFFKRINNFNTIVFLSIVFLNIFFFIYTSIVFIQFNFIETFFSSFLFFLLFLLFVFLYTPSFFILNFNLTFVKIILIFFSFLFLIFYFNINPYWASAFPTFPLLSLDLDLPFRADAFYHASLIHSILNYGYPSTGQHDVPIIYYHVLSHYIEALIYKITEIDVFDSYGLFFYYKFVFVISSILVFISQNLKQNYIIAYIISLIFFIDIIFYNSIIIGSHSLWFPSAIFFLSFNKIWHITFNKNRLNFLDYFILIFTIFLIVYGKISLGLAYGSFLFTLIFLKNFKDWRFYLILLLTTIPILFYFRNFFGFNIFNNFGTHLIFKDALLKFSYIFFSEDPEIRKVVYICIFNIFILTLLCYFFKNKRINQITIASYSTFLFFTINCLFLRHLGFTKSHIYYMAIGLGTVLNSYLYCVLINEINVNIKLTEFSKNFVKYLCYFANFIFNQLGVAILFLLWVINFRKFFKKNIKFYITWLSISVTAFYIPARPDIFDFNINYIISKIRFYKNIPFSNISEKSMLFRDQSVIRYSNNTIVIDDYYHPINSVLSEKNQLDLFKIIYFSGFEKQNFFLQFHRPFFNFKNFLKLFMQQNQLDPKNTLLFFSKEVLEKEIYTLKSFNKVPERILAAGIAMYSFTGIPLINGIDKVDTLYGFKQYGSESLTLAKSKLDKEIFCKFKKNIVIVNSFENPSFNVIKCVN